MKLAFCTLIAVGFLLLTPQPARADCYEAPDFASCVGGQWIGLWDFASYHFVADGNYEGLEFFHGTADLSFWFPGGSSLFAVNGVGAFGWWGETPAVYVYFWADGMAYTEGWGQLQLTFQGVIPINWGGNIMITNVSVWGNEWMTTYSGRVQGVQVACVPVPTHDVTTHGFFVNPNGQGPLQPYPPTWEGMYQWLVQVQDNFGSSFANTQIWQTDFAPPVDTCFNPNIAPDIGPVPGVDNVVWDVFLDNRTWLTGTNYEGSFIGWNLGAAAYYRQKHGAGLGAGCGATLFAQMNHTCKSNYQQTELAGLINALSGPNNSPLSSSRSGLWDTIHWPVLNTPDLDPVEYHVMSNRLNWAVDLGDHTGFRVERREQGTEDFLFLGNTANAFFVDTMAEPGHTYCYRVAVEDDYTNISTGAGLNVDRGAPSNERCGQATQIVIHSVDATFAPSVENLDVTFSITPPGRTVPFAKMEIFMNGDPNPIALDGIPHTATSETVHWDGTKFFGPNTGEFVSPLESPFTVRLTISDQQDFSSRLSFSRTTAVEIESMTLSPAGPQNLVKPNRVAIEIDQDVEVLVKIKKKDGTGEVTQIPLQVTWTFQDPDDTAGNAADPTGNGVDPNGAAGDDNTPVANGGKRGAGRILWKQAMGFTTVVAPDGQSAVSTTKITGADTGKAKLIFSSSAIAGDNYKLVPQVRNGALPPLASVISDIWSVRKALNLTISKRMVNGADVDSILSQANVEPAFSGDGYTDYTTTPATALLAADTVEFLIPITPPTGVDEIPDPADEALFLMTGDAGAKSRLETKATAWVKRLIRSRRAPADAWEAGHGLGGPNASAIIGAVFVMTKMDGSLDPAQVTAFYPPGLLVKYEDESGIVYAGPLGLGFDPNAAEWPYTIEGFENDTHGQVIWIFKSLAPARELRVGRHEVGHASDHVNFGPGDHETATPKLMHPNVLDDVFSGPSILHLRGVTP